MRGKQHEHWGENHPRRITPAHAGKTGFFNFLCKLCRDHPRACGENVFESVLRPQHIGSPPRMRGQLNLSGRRLPGKGITPAHAGKTLRSARLYGRSQDHPRACGENHCIIRHNNVTLGSPPRMRGKLGSLTASPNLSRITPAHAGKTFGVSFPLSCP